MISERVCRYLLERGKLTARQVGEARRTQDFFGGELVSHLLKLGLVDEEILGEALAEVSGVPHASVERLRSVPQQVIETVPVELASKHRACPFEIEERRLRVAMVNPRDARAVGEIQAASGYPVEAWIASEYRVYQALERYYGIRIPAIRSIALPPRPAPRAASVPSDERTVGSEAGGVSADVGLDGRPLDAEVDFEEYFRSPEPYIAGSAPGTPPAAQSKREEAPRSPAEPEPTPSASLESLESGLSEAGSRERIAEVLLGYCAARAARAALFAVGRDGIRGVEGRGRGFDGESVRRVAIPPDASTLFDAALRSRDFYFGVVPPLPANRDLFTILGGRLPANALVLPLVVRDRTVALLYLDDDDRPMARPDIPLMRRIAAKTGLAFEILLLRGKLREI